MATIEERAKDYARHDFGLVSVGKLHGYFEGAVDQRKIDIDKAAEWIRMNALEYTMNYDSKTMEEDFRKAMEEE